MPNEEMSRRVAEERKRKRASRAKSREREVLKNAKQEVSEVVAARRRIEEARSRAAQRRGDG